MPGPTPISPQIRFWKHVQKTESCWLWTGSKNYKGYGAFRLTRTGTEQRAHRLAYQWLRGEIPAGLQLDHLCRIRHCVNPDHLEVVDNRTNIIRGNTIIARQVNRDRCIRGHLFDGKKKHKNERTCSVCMKTRYKLPRPADG